MLNVLLWLLLFAVVAGGAVVAALRVRTRRQREELWGALDGEPTHPEWNEEALGVSPVRVHTDPPRLPAERATAPEPSAARPKAQSTPARAAVPADPFEERAHADASPEGPQASARSDEPSGSDAPLAPEADAPAEEPRAVPNPELSGAARPMRPRPEWWEDDVPGTGALLRSLVAATEGSAALVRPVPDGGYLILSAAGPASAVLHANADARRLGHEASVLDDLARDGSTVVLGASEAGLLPGMTSNSVGETAVRTLGAAPAPRRLLVVDIPLDRPLDGRTERLFIQYADLLADLLGLRPTPEAAPPAPADPLRVAMERIGAEMQIAREAGRQLAFALVVPDNVEALLDADEETRAAREAVLRQRLTSIVGSRVVEPMGEPFVFGALCEADGANAERWARAAATSGDPLRIGMAIYRPRHVTPDLLRQEAAHALHKAYTGDDSCVIVD